MMFWAKLKSTTAIALAGVLLSGTGLIAYRAMGRTQVPTATASQQAKHPASRESKPAEPATAGARHSELEAIGQARIAVAKKLRDSSYKLWQAGEISVTEYLNAQKRYDDVVDEVMVKTDADRIQHLEHQVAGLKQLEDRARKLYTSGIIRVSDVFTLELARLDAEYALVKAKLKTAADSK